MDEQDKWYELRTRNNNRTLQAEKGREKFKNPHFLEILKGDIKSLVPKEDILLLLSLA